MYATKVVQLLTDKRQLLEKSPSSSRVLSSFHGQNPPLFVENAIFFS